MKNLILTFVLLLSITIASSIFISGCSDDPVTPTTQSGPATNTFSTDVASQWFNLELKLIKQTTPSLGFTPPVAARVFGYTGIALYESVVNGMSGYRSFGGLLNAMPGMPRTDLSSPYHWPSCANAALYTIVKKLFINASAQNFTTMDSLYNALNTSFQEESSPEIISKSLEYGTQVGNAVYDYSSSDGGRDGQLHNTDPTYVPPVCPECWIPTPPAFAPQPVQPHWGNNRAFIAANVNSNQPEPPVRFDSAATSLFYSQALEVYSVNSKLIQAEKDIALFWADGGANFLRQVVTGYQLQILF